MPKQKFYVVFQGKKTGVFNSWSECEFQVKGFKGALFKSFSTYEVAKKAFNDYKLGNVACSSPLVNSICVDASCTGNPGIVEYQAYDMETKTILFCNDKVGIGTNNLGEFLAIVDALKYCLASKRDCVIYSDSQTAMSWVSKKQVNSSLERDNRTNEIWSLIDNAIKWLKLHEYSIKVLKWDTVKWGEIPADFGRK